MSKFSGKCDFYDGFIMIHNDSDEEKIVESLKYLKLYVRGKDDREHLVKSDTIKDIAKYYPYLESVAHSSNAYGSNKGSMIVVLSSDSFIDMEEKEHRQYKINDVLKYWRKCKREKKPFDEEECLKKLWWTPDDSLKEIVHRVAEKGNKAEFDDIHMPMWEHNRRRWFEEMVRLGYSEREAYNWCFKAFFEPEDIIEKRLGRKLNEK